MGGRVTGEWRRTADMYETPELAKPTVDMLIRSGRPSYTVPLVEFARDGFPIASPKNWDFRKCQWKGASVEPLFPDMKSRTISKSKQRAT
jgi:hypothetical protein